MGKGRKRTHEDVIMDIVRDQLAPGVGFTSKWKLVDDCGADSLDIIEIIMAVEDEFGVEISDEEAEGMHTPRDIITHVGACLKENAVL